MDKKYPLRVKKGLNPVPLILLQEQHEKICNHYLKLRELEFKRVKLVVDKDEFESEVW